jgi:dimethylamine/trimethylamine dehydrogenase
VNTATRIVCSQNATTGEEYRRGWHPEKFAAIRSSISSVLVVGGGPAGLECGVVLARRGVENVHVVDDAKQLGGHMAWVPRLPGLSEWSRVVDYREAMAKTLPNLTLISGTRLTADDVIDYGADAVVLATGAEWARDGLSSVTRAPIPGGSAELRWILTPDQVMSGGKLPPAGPVIVYDAEGYFMGPSLAEKFAREGLDVVYLTPRGSVGHYMQYTGEDQSMIPTLHKLGVQIRCNTEILEFTSDAAMVRQRGAELVEQIPFGAIILATQRLPRNRLYKELTERAEDWMSAGIQGVYRCGDCVSPRQQFADAIFDGHRLGREIDSGNPSVAAPWIREERFIGHSEDDYVSMRSDARVLAIHPV